ncbi:MAG: fibronectin type III domain-containing protein, partial [Verrucomicrobia bacterium]|nr:fibronectin type III domain-containing protein [Verrucomicrobiota bacterium]
MKCSGTFAVLLCGLFFVGPVSAMASESVILVWNRSTNTNVVGYNVYYGTASGVYANEMSVGNITKARISGLANGVTYFFAAKSRISSGAESAFSNQASYTVPQNLTISGAAYSPGQYAFSVSGASGNFVVEASTDLIYWVSLETNA